MLSHFFVFIFRDQRLSLYCEEHVYTYTYLIAQRLYMTYSCYCATSRKVAGSIPDGVIGIFHWRNPSRRTMALGVTQPLTEMSTRNISWGVKVPGAQGWQPYHLHVPTVLKCGSLNLLEPSGPVMGLLFILLFYLYQIIPQCNICTTIWSGAQCSLDVYHWTACLAVTDIVQNVPNRN